MKFLDLPFYSVIVRSFYSEKPNEFVGGINENYTPWVKRRLKMVRNAERQASSYMTHKFKQNPQQYRKNEFIGVFNHFLLNNYQPLGVPKLLP